MFGLNAKIKQLELRNAQIENTMIDQHRKHDIKMSSLRQEFDFVASCTPLYKIGEERWFVIEESYGELKAEKLEIEKIKISKVDGEIIIKYYPTETYASLNGCLEHRVFKTKTLALKYIKEQTKCTPTPPQA